MKNKKITWSGLSHVGRVRTNNEDHFLVMKLTQEGLYRLGKFGTDHDENAEYIFAVCDGMGGANSGEFASKIVVEKLAAKLPAYFQKTEDKPLTEAIANELYTLIVEINEIINHIGKYYEECQGMGTTLTLVWVTGKMMHLVHIGDSRLYLLREDQKILQVSEDHTYVNWLLQKGFIKPSQVANHPQKNVLTQSLGSMSSTLFPQIQSICIQDNERILLCSDGLTDSLMDFRIEEYLKQKKDSFWKKKGFDSLAAALVHFAVDELGRDNTTALVFETAAITSSETAKPVKELQSKGDLPKKNKIVRPKKRALKKTTKVTPKK
jgi:PPM family protein phosphatase